MILSLEEQRLFWKLYDSLIAFTDAHFEIPPAAKDRRVPEEAAGKRKVEVRNYLFDHVEVIDRFYEENPDGLTESELGQILQWKNHVKDSFVIYKQYKKYCALFQEGEDSKVYGVLGITNSFEEMLPYFPMMVKAVLLPFKGKIVYDGLMETYAFHFGSNIRHRLKEEFERAKAKYGVIESLPFLPPHEKARKEGLVRFYLNNRSKSPVYEDELQDLLAEDPSLEVTYHREWGALSAKKFVKRFKQLGFKNSWFAVIDDMVVASGKDENGLNAQVQNIVPANLKRYVYTFKIP